jgi:hypothetical protein
MRYGGIQIISIPYANVVVIIMAYHVVNVSMDMQVPIVMKQ